MGVQTLKGRRLVKQARRRKADSVNREAFSEGSRPPRRLTCTTSQSSRFWRASVSRSEGLRSWYMFPKPRMPSTCTQIGCHPRTRNPRQQPDSQLLMLHACPCSPPALCMRGAHLRTEARGFRGEEPCCIGLSARADARPSTAPL